MRCGPLFAQWHRWCCPKAVPTRSSNSVASVLKHQAVLLQRATCDVVGCEQACQAEPRLFSLLQQIKTSFMCHRCCSALSQHTKLSQAMPCCDRARVRAVLFAVGDFLGRTMSGLGPWGRGAPKPLSILFYSLAR